MCWCHVFVYQNIVERMPNTVQTYSMCIHYSTNTGRKIRFTMASRTESALHSLSQPRRGIWSNLRTSGDMYVVLTESFPKDYCEHSCLRAERASFSPGHWSDPVETQLFDWLSLTTTCHLSFKDQLIFIAAGSLSNVLTLYVRVTGSLSKGISGNRHHKV
jgi:hypothetical protein